MSRPFARRLILSTMFAACAAVNGPVLLAQAQLPQELRARGAAAAQAPAAPAGLDQRGADELRNDLRELMRQYPPSLAQVIRLDPALLSNPSYLAPYPLLAAFVQARPEVARHPEYFFSFAGQGNWWQEPMSPEMRLREAAIASHRNTMEFVMIFGVVSAIAFAVVWLFRMVIAHRRWLRVTRLQSDLNNRLLERMGSNEQLLAYLQSQAGQQLLVTPPVGEPASSSLAAPISRILWAVQAGTVLVSGGAGFLVVRRYVMPEVGDGLLTVGVLAIAVGFGFALASVASYLLSQRFGLLETSRDRADGSGRV
ncbi:MAG: hypothetical protein IT183_01025 [Acidobacteria bacterium]|nr:hypothetical protein [Acidobacteriota bacterium]